MKKAVMYGAGNIGRGFLGKTFSDSGYEVCFIDVAKDIVDRLNKERSYPVRIVANKQQREEIVENVRAVDGSDMESVAEEIACADIMAIAVGVKVLPMIIKPVCAGLRKRFDNNADPLNIIICENLIDADKYIKVLIEREMGAENNELLDKNIGLVKASIGRMVPIMTDKMREGNILRVWVEEYDELPVDKEAFVGEIPSLNHIIPFSPFGFYIKRKIFIHNMGHAICAYLGWQKGFSHIYECVNDDEIRDIVKVGMENVAIALNIEYGVPLHEVMENVYNLLERFGNKYLGDTVLRVGRDPIRKLDKNDRLTGAALYCVSYGTEPNSIIKGIASCLRYNDGKDKEAAKLQQMIKNKGLEATIEQICGLERCTYLFDNIVNQYHTL